jgi:hypothetical protein
MAENILNKTFKNSSEIDEFFKTLNSNGFVDWYNKNHSTKAAFVSNAEIKNTEDFSKFFSNIKKFLGKDEINLIEFICVSTFVIVETFSSFKPIIEKVGDNSNPGISYSYNAINGIKLSYNNNTLNGNKTAFELFNDPDYILAHSHKPYGNILRRTTDTRWQSTQFPLGFSGNPEKETSTNLADNTFLAEADFNKFRGRGYVKTLGRINYIDLIKYIQKYTGANPKIISYKAKWTNYGANYDLVASISSNFDWNDLFKNSDLEIACIAIYLDNINNGNYLNIDPNQGEVNLDKAIRNVAANINDTALYIQSFLSKVKQLVNSINNTAPPASGEQNIGQTASQPAQEPTEDPIVEQAREDDKKDTNAQNKSEENQKVTGLTNFFKPTIEVKHIDFELDSKNKQKTDEAISSTGYLPFVWYSGIQLEHNYIQSLQISSVGLLPTLNMVFADQYGQFGFEDNGFPLDDSKIKIFISSRTKVLKPILMDFKIKKFKRLADNLYSIEGVADINYMFLKKFESYSQKTSFETMQEFARKSSLGFNSNIDNTNDKMSRINPGVSGIDFVSSIVNEAYKSDDAFLWAYVDFYYNLNYLDVETALSVDVQGVGNVQNMGLEALSKLQVSNNEDVTRIAHQEDHNQCNILVNLKQKITLIGGFLFTMLVLKINFNMF